MQHEVIFLRATDTCRLHPHRRGEIGGAKRHCLKPRRTGGNFLDMGDASGGFDDDFQRNRICPALCSLDSSHQRIDRVNVRSAPDFRDHDLVQPVRGFLQNLHHVAIPVGSVQPVDPHAQILVAPVDIMGRGDDVPARFGLVVGRDRVLKIKVDHVRRACRHLPEYRRARAGAEQLATVRTGRRGRLKTKTHRCNFLTFMIALRVYCCVAACKSFCRCRNGTQGHSKAGIWRKPNCWGRLQG